MDDLENALQNHLPERHKKLLPLNMEALKKGAEFASAREKQIE